MAPHRKNPVPAIVRPSSRKNYTRAKNSMDACRRRRRGYVNAFQSVLPTDNGFGFGAEIGIQYPELHEGP